MGEIRSPSSEYAFRPSSSIAIMQRSTTSTCIARTPSMICSGAPESPSAYTPLSSPLCAMNRNLSSQRVRQLMLSKAHITSRCAPSPSVRRMSLPPLTYIRSPFSVRISPSARSDATACASAGSHDDVTGAPSMRIWRYSLPSAAVKYR